MAFASFDDTGRINRGSAPIMIDLSTTRTKEARLAKIIGHVGYQLLVVFGVLLLLGGIGLLIEGKPDYFAWTLSASLVFMLPAIWWKRYLSILPANGDDITSRLSGDILSRLKDGEAQHPQAIWNAISDHWHSQFIVHHLLLTNELVASLLSMNEQDLEPALSTAKELADAHNSSVIELGFLSAGLLLNCQQIKDVLTQAKAKPEDIHAVADWLGRNITHTNRKRRYGGIGRDWAFGFTPILDRLGLNVSLAIAQHGAHFDLLSESEGFLNIEKALENHATAIALTGQEGIGKTTSVYALAQRMIEGRSGKAVAYHQVISLNAADLISNAQHFNGLENLMLSVTHEASLAGHIVLFFDNAQLFFNEGTGAIDASSVLLPILQSKSLPTIFAFNPEDFQRLKSTNPSIANMLTPVVLQEMVEPDVMRILEDNAVGLENKSKVLITYAALHEAYALSGRYEQDEAYPGKALKLLEQSIPKAEHSIITAKSVQAAVEQTRGVKVSTANSNEADKLLNLEDLIHERMINQTHAVSAVARALRRNRAGVTNPKRPIGSFLFLGPTGVGKTELAKAIAAVYFGDEANMVRLDMSEYQQPDDVQRLLDTGVNSANSLLMSVRNQPFTVVLLDEIEKAHPNTLNLLLQLLDEGQLTDSSGRAASFKDCVIIATSNAGAEVIRDRISKGEELENFAAEFTDQLISGGQFKPELLNRFDEIILFRPLNDAELAQVVGLMLNGVNVTLSNQNIQVNLTETAIKKIVAVGNDPRLGARPMRRALQKAVEDVIAQKILKGEVKPGDTVLLDEPDIAL